MVNVSTQAILDILDNPVTNRPYSEVYDYIYSELTLNGAPAPGVDAGVWQWFYGAALTNRSEGFFSQFIREYTSIQSAVRNGTPLTQAQLDNASDLIAQNVIADIMTSNGLIPSLQQIGDRDLEGVVQTYFNNDNGAWSGNILLVLLGNRSFFDSNIIDTPSNTYNLGAMFKALYGAADGALSSSFSIYDAFSQIASLLTPSGGTVDAGMIFDVAVDTVDFVSEAYGGSLVELMLSPFSVIEIGQSDSDVIDISGIDPLSSAGNGFVHAGDGDDTVKLNAFHGVIDGGGGLDAVEYESAADIKLLIGRAGDLLGSQSAVPFVGLVDHGYGDPTLNWYSYLFGVEQLSLGSGSDFIQVSGMDHLIGGLHLDAGSGQDELNFEDHDASIVVDFDTSIASSNGRSIQFAGIENIVGSAFNDLFISLPTTAQLDGGSGIDRLSFSNANAAITLSSIDVQSSALEEVEGTGFGDVLDLRSSGLLSWLLDENLTIFGGGGDDTIFGNDAENRLAGGSGNDSMFGEAGDDHISGGTGDDTIIGGAESYAIASDNDELRGGDGNDTIHGGAGGDSLFGEADHDYLYGGAGDDILFGGGGYDSLYGGDGEDELNDEVVYGGGGTYNGGTGNDIINISVSGGVQFDQYTYFNNAYTSVTFGVGSGNDLVTSENGLDGGGMNWGLRGVRMLELSKADIVVSWSPSYVTQTADVLYLAGGTDPYYTYHWKKYVGDLTISIKGSTDTLTIEDVWGTSYWRQYVSDNRVEETQAIPSSFNIDMLDGATTVNDLVGSIWIPSAVDYVLNMGGPGGSNLAFMDPNNIWSLPDQQVQFADQYFGGMA